MSTPTLRELVAALVTENAALREALETNEVTLTNLRNDALAERPFGPYAVKGLGLALDTTRCALSALARTEEKKP